MTATAVSRILRSIADRRRTDTQLPVRETCFAGIATHDERERLLLACLTLVAERGIADVAISEITDRAGVDRASFDDVFSGRADCALKAFDFCADQLLARMTGAILATPGDYAEAARRGLAALLGWLAASPGFAYVASVELPRIGKAFADRREALLERITELIGPGDRTRDPAVPPRSPVVEGMMAGAIWRVVERHVHEGRTREIQAALPAVTFTVFSMLLGPGEAQRLAALPRPRPT